MTGRPTVSPAVSTTAAAPARDGRRPARPAQQDSISSGLHR